MATGSLAECGASAMDHRAIPLRIVLFGPENTDGAKEDKQCQDPANQFLETPENERSMTLMVYPAGVCASDGWQTATKNMYVCNESWSYKPGMSTQTSKTDLQRDH